MTGQIQRPEVTLEAERGGQDDGNQLFPGAEGTSGKAISYESGREVLESLDTRDIDGIGVFKAAHGEASGHEEGRLACAESGDQTGIARIGTDIFIVTFEA